MDLKQLEQKRDAHVTGFFWLAFNTIFIFGIPAVAAALAGKKMNAFFEVRGIQIALLLVAFISSWVIVVKSYRKKLAELRIMDEQIKIARANIVSPAEVLKT